MSRSGPEYRVRVSAAGRYDSSQTVVRIRGPGSLVPVLQDRRTGGAESWSPAPPYWRETRNWSRDMSGTSATLFAVQIQSGRRTDGSGRPSCRRSMKLLIDQSRGHFDMISVVLAEVLVTSQAVNSNPDSAQFQLVRVTVSLDLLVGWSINPFLINGLQRADVTYDITNWANFRQSFSVSILVACRATSCHLAAKLIDPTQRT